LGIQSGTNVTFVAAVFVTPNLNVKFRYRKLKNLLRIDETYIIVSLVLLSKLSKVKLYKIKVF